MAKKSKKRKMLDVLKAHGLYKKEHESLTLEELIEILTEAL